MQVQVQTQELDMNSQVCITGSLLLSDGTNEVHIARGMYPHVYSNSDLVGFESDCTVETSRRYLEQKSWNPRF